MRHFDFYFKRMAVGDKLSCGEWGVHYMQLETDNPHQLPVFVIEQRGVYQWVTPGSGEADRQLVRAWVEQHVGLEGWAFTRSGSDDPLWDETVPTLRNVLCPVAAWLFTGSPQTGQPVQRLAIGQARRFIPIQGANGKGIKQLDYYTNQTVGGIGTYCRVGGVVALEERQWTGSRYQLVLSGYLRLERIRESTLLELPTHAAALGFSDAHALLSSIPSLPPCLFILDVTPISPYGLEGEPHDVHAKKSVRLGVKAQSHRGPTAVPARI